MSYDGGLSVIEKKGRAPRGAWAGSLFGELEKSGRDEEAWARSVRRPVAAQPR